MTLPVFLRSATDKAVLLKQLKATYRTQELHTPHFLTTTLSEEDPWFVAEQVVGTIGAVSWDTSHFGFPVGRLHLWRLPAPLAGETDANARLDQVIGEAVHGRTFRVIYCRISASEWMQTHALETAGFHLMDQLVTFEGSCGVFPAPERVTIHTLDREDARAVATVKRIGAEAFMHSRFYNDRRFDRVRVDDLYNRWSVAALEKGEVYVARYDDRVAGFVSCESEGPSVQIQLIAVAPEARGAGVGSNLVQVIRTLYADRCSVLRVGTQLTNKGAIALYTACGLKLSRTELTFHHWTR